MASPRCSGNGLILAGAAPFQAVLVQAVVMFLVLAATADDEPATLRTGYAAA